MSPVMDWNDVPVILTADEAADLLRIHPNTLKQLIADGDIPAVKVGRAWRISKDAVQAYVTPVKAAKPWGRGTTPQASRLWDQALADLYDEAHAYRDFECKGYDFTVAVGGLGEELYAVLNYYGVYAGYTRSWTDNGDGTLTANAGGAEVVYGTETGEVLGVTAGRELYDYVEIMSQMAEDFAEPEADEAEAEDVKPYVGKYAKVVPTEDGRWAVVVDTRKVAKDIAQAVGGQIEPDDEDDED